MAYRYNQSAGKVSGANPMTAYYPTGLTQTSVAEPPPVEFAQKSGGASGLFGKFNQGRIRENQLKFGMADGQPVHMKLARDRFSYAFAMGLTVAGTLWSCYSLYKLSQPKK